MRLLAFASHHEGQVESQNIIGAFTLGILANDHLKHGQELFGKGSLVTL